MTLSGIPLFWTPTSADKKSPAAGRSPPALLELGRIGCVRVRYLTVMIPILGVGRDHPGDPGSIAAHKDDGEADVKTRYRCMRSSINAPLKPAHGRLDGLATGGCPAASGVNFRARFAKSRPRALPCRRAGTVMPKIDLTEVPSIRGTGYPPPFSAACTERLRQRLGNAGGLNDFGVNLMRLPPGFWSSCRVAKYSISSPRIERCAKGFLNRAGFRASI